MCNKLGVLDTLGRIFCMSCTEGADDAIIEILDTPSIARLKCGRCGLGLAQSREIAGDRDYDSYVVTHSRDGAPR